jgi:hypothetical protein
MTISWDNGDQHSDWMDYHLDQETKVAENTQRQQLEDTVTSTLKERGASDSTIAAFKYHIGNESSWNPNLRHTDQHDPRWRGTEAEFAHGLLSEGGPEWEPMYKYAQKHNTSWNDPRTQINYAVDNLQSRGLWDRMQGGTKEQAATTMLNEYLRPGERYRVAREQAIQSGRMDTDPFGDKGAGSMPYLNKETGRPHMTVTPSRYPTYENAVIDHEHDVPLIAGGLMNDDGEVIGSTYSRLLPRYANIMGHTQDMFEGVHYHEMAEIDEMERNLLPSGMPSAQAYKQAHDGVATPTEENWVRDRAKKLGEDPDKFWAAYQDHWKNMAKITENAKPEKVHPNLYLHPYDGHKFQADVEKLSGRTIANHPKTAKKEYLPPKPPSFPQQKSRTKGVYTQSDPAFEKAVMGVMSKYGVNAKEAQDWVTYGSAGDPVNAWMGGPMGQIRMRPEGLAKIPESQNVEDARNQPPAEPPKSIGEYIGHRAAPEPTPESEAAANRGLGLEAGSKDIDKNFPDPQWEQDRKIKESEEKVKAFNKQFKKDIEKMKIPKKDRQKLEQLLKNSNVIPWPFSQKDIDFGMGQGGRWAGYKGFGQTALEWDEQSHQWKDMNAKILLHPSAEP